MTNHTLALLEPSNAAYPPSSVLITIVRVHGLFESEMVFPGGSDGNALGQKE